MELKSYPIEVIVLANMYNGEIGRGFIALEKLGEGKYSLPTTYLGEEEDSKTAVERLVKEQICSLEAPIFSEVAPSGATFTNPNRTQDERKVAILHPIQMVDNIAKEDVKEGYVFFQADHQEKRVTLSTDEETIILYRDGRITGDAELVNDHAQMITGVM